ncbi:Crp/Fnr family transcriptional regulator [Metabacillus arenae]|uniref:Crp/Fnr family transcriptional regulator n=1 Tax=Metabacillus arenae TaxID=2771434 RepID=A0A926RZ54_9BACI|nr:Crp/Fnr family transcriptional regulator [Metabacillus arenae]MBD1382460.1 Crp/Fnr family transcriptional regulator [Metabacillus arenae]
MDDANLEKLLNQHQWLHNMLQNMPSPYRSHWEIQYFSPNDSIAMQDEQVRYFHILVQGELKVEHLLAEGYTYTIARLKPGQMIGDIELNLNRPFACQIEAISPAILLAIKADVYQQWIQEDAHFLAQVNKQLALKLYEMAKQSAENTYLPLRDKLLRYLYDLVKHVNFNEQVAYITTLPRLEMANQLGVTVRSINRVLKELKEQRIIYVNKKQVILNEWSRIMIEHELENKEQK